MGFFIDKITGIEALMHGSRVSQSSGHEKSVKHDKTDTAFNDILKANIEKNKVNIDSFVVSGSLSREKLKLLAEIIQVQLKSTFLSFGNDSEEKSSNFNIEDLLLKLSNNSSLIDSQVSKIEQSGPVILDSKSHNIENVISKASKKYKVNSELICSVIRAESDFNPD